MTEALLSPPPTVLTVLLTDAVVDVTAASVSASALAGLSYPYLGLSSGEKEEEADFVLFFTTSFHPLGGFIGFL